MSGARGSVPAGDGQSFPIAGKETDLARLCREYHVRTLELFGSAAGSAFDPERSDLDFLVEFESLAPADYATAFFALKHALEQLFGRPVDLVVSSAIRNPYFRQSVEQSKALLYAA
ncbi:MAG TPA: nucleotidyltransferase domain-containing protein [Terracidiphilus sp.]|nr:nucleotidyltransferase domain-containing protein [Terracidiphilus sp.]